MAKYRVDFTVTRRLDGEADFTEIGFGSSGAWGGVDDAAHMVSAALQTRDWEIDPGMPNPWEVDQ